MRRCRGPYNAEGLRASGQCHPKQASIDFDFEVSTWALKISPRPSVIPREARNLNLPLKSEMSRFRFAPLDMTSRFYCALTV